MPFKDYEKKLAYQRKWYADHKERVIAKVNKRKHTLYAGKCLLCGAPTLGQTKGKSAQYCSRPECKSKRYKMMPKKTFYPKGKK